MTSPPTSSTRDEELANRFKRLIPVLNEWGQEVIEVITSLLKANSLEKAVQIQPAYRVKDTESFVSKAFYREKNYADPYKNITDKVGVRVVFLTTKQVSYFAYLVESHPDWTIEWAKKIGETIELDPNAFSYESAHLIVRRRAPTATLLEEHLEDIACEVQIRTLLQHAYAQVSHGTVYKGRFSHEHDIRRKLARSQALMETVDDHFLSMFDAINSEKLDPARFSQKVTKLFKKLWPEFRVDKTDVGLYSYIYDTMYVPADIMPDKHELPGELTEFVKEYKGELRDIINRNRVAIARQPILIYVAYLLKNRPDATNRNWELGYDVLNEITMNMGISRDEYD